MASKRKKRKTFLDKLLDTAEEAGDLSEERMLNQVDTFMFAVKHLLKQSRFTLNSSYDDL